MFKQELTSALGDALEHFNGGASDVEAVTKSAADNNFNTEQTRRLVETFNTAKSLHHYKTADDRSAHFDIVNPADVINGLFGPEATAKSAAAKVVEQPSLTKNAHVLFYDEAPQGTMAKTASVLDDITVTEYDQPTKADRATDIHKKAQVYRRLAEHADADGDLHRGTYSMALPKLASHLDSYLYEDGGKRGEIMQGIVLKYGEAGATVVTDLAGRMVHKVSTSDIGAVPRVNLAPSKYASVFDQVDGLVTALNEMESHDAIRDCYNKAAADLHEVTGLAKEAREELDKKGPSLAKTLFTIPGTINTQVQKGLDVVKENIPAAPDAGPSRKAERGALVLDNLRRKLLVQNLLNTDDIIAGGDPEQIRGAYQTFVDVAPEQSMQPEIVRAVLRQAVNSPGGMSPFDAKALADVQATVAKGRA